MNSISGKNYSIIIIAAVLVVSLLIGLVAGGGFALLLIPILLIASFIFLNSRPQPVLIPIRKDNPSDLHNRRGPPSQ